MSRSAWIWIITGVALGHVALFLILSREPVLPKRRYVPPPNFHVRETRTVDEQSGDTYVYREISVSTRLKNLGPQPEESATPVFTPSP